MSAWTLSINGDLYALADLGIERFDLQLLNLGEDTLTLSEKPGPLNAPAPLSYGDRVQLVQDGNIRFIGRVVTSPRAGIPGQIEKRSYVCKNIFWELNRIVYEQEWRSDPGNTHFRGRVILAKDFDGNRQRVDAAIIDVLAFAQSEGLSFTHALGAMPAVPPDSEHVDITCMEAIRNLLRWEPSVLTSVDYSSGTPEIVFVPRSDAAAAELVATDLQSLSIAPRFDLQLDGVVLNYEILNQVDGFTYSDAVQDAAGDVEGLNVLKQTIQMPGYEASSTEQRIDVETVDVPLTDGGFGASWWSKYIPTIGKIENIEIYDLQLGDGADLPRILVAGQVPEWTKKTAQTGLVKAKARGMVAGCFVDEIVLETYLTFTDAETKTYKQLASATYAPPEDIPEGLAARLLESRSSLHVEGSLSIVAKEPTFNIRTSDVCNLLPGGASRRWQDSEYWDDLDAWLDTSNGFPGFESMRAVVNSIRITKDAAKCVTQIGFGPPVHLGPQDFIALAAATRSRRVSSWSRSEPSSKASGAMTEGGFSPNENGANAAMLPTTSGKAKANLMMLTEGTYYGETILKPDWSAPVWRGGSV